MITNKDLLVVEWEILLGFALLFGAAIGFMAKNIYDRIRKVEEKQEDTVTVLGVRRLIEDKVNPIIKEVDGMKTKIDEIYRVCLQFGNK